MDDSEWSADLSSNDESDSVSGSYSWDEVGTFGMETDMTTVDTASSSFSPASSSYSLGSEDTEPAAAPLVVPASSLFSPTSSSYISGSEDTEQAAAPAVVPASSSFPPGGHLDGYNHFAAEGGAFMEAWDEVGMFHNLGTDTHEVETASSSHSTGGEDTEQAAAPVVGPASSSYSIAVRDDPGAAIGSMVRIPPPSVLTYPRESSAERVDPPAGQRHAAAETTADLLARGCREKLPIDEFQQLLVSVRFAHSTPTPAAAPACASRRLTTTTVFAMHSWTTLVYSSSAHKFWSRASGSFGSRRSNVESRDQKTSGPIAGARRDRFCGQRLVPRGSGVSTARLNVSMGGSCATMSTHSSQMETPALAKKSWRGTYGRFARD
eukprot:COSAG02_NODE_1589_length_11792_cov_203.500898_10_plen_379_part_00